MGLQKEMNDAIRRYCMRYKGLSRSHRILKLRDGRMVSIKLEIL